MSLVKSDVLIIGTGVAGLSCAIKLAMKRPDISITLVSKTTITETNTSWAQGGIATVWDFEDDNFDLHIEDTLDAGDGLCDKEIVRLVIEEGHTRVKELIEWGASFSKMENGAYDLGKEGAA